jgi:hypothetical protein
MKLHFLLLCLICFGHSIMAQADNTPIYLRFPTVPPFNITQVPDSSRFGKDDLVKKRSTLIFIFSPDCDHCRQKTMELTANIHLFKKAQVIMASPLEHRILKRFYEEFKIADHPNIILGRDPTNFFGTFYKIHSLPALFLYDKKGRFVKAFDSSIAVNAIAGHL